MQNEAERVLKVVTVSLYRAEVFTMESLNACLCISKIFGGFLEISISTIALLANFVLKLPAENARVENFINNVLFFAIDLNRL